MKNHPFPGSFDPDGPAYDPNLADNVAAELVQQLLRPGSSDVVGWDPIPLERACRTIAGSRDGSIRRIHTVIPCPRQPRGALPVVEYARTLADRCGLHVHCGLRQNTITVTFEQLSGADE